MKITPCACKVEEDCPHCAWPGCVYQLEGDLTNDHCETCKAGTWHLDGKCLRSDVHAGVRGFAAPQQSTEGD